jgi:hypothetical protein
LSRYTGHYDFAVSWSLERGCAAALRICRAQKSPGRKVRLVVIDDGGMLTERLWHLRSSDNPLKLKSWGLDRSIFGHIEIISVQFTASGIQREPDPRRLTKSPKSSRAAC